MATKSLCCCHFENSVRVLRFWRSFDSEKKTPYEGFCNSGRIFECLPFISMQTKVKPFNTDTVPMCTMCYATVNQNNNIVWHCQNTVNGCAVLRSKFLPS